MTPSQISLVEASFRKVLERKHEVGALFYSRLFEIDPSTKRMFARTNMVEQRDKLMMALGFVVGALRSPEKLDGPLRELARRHVGYGVMDSHYSSVGAALLCTLERGLGAEFTAEVAESWATAYGMLSRTMIAAANAPQRLAA